MELFHPSIAFAYTSLFLHSSQTQKELLNGLADYAGIREHHYGQVRLQLRIEPINGMLM